MARTSMFKGLASQAGIKKVAAKQKLGKETKKEEKAEAKSKPKSKSSGLQSSIIKGAMASKGY